MSKYAKYSQDLKLKVVLDYFKSHLGTYTLCHKYGIARHSTIDKWVHNYQAFGLKGLIVRKPKKDYPGDYKIKVLKWRNSHHESYARTALHFHLLNPATVFSWNKKMEVKGITGLYTHRGPHKMRKTKSNSKLKHLQRTNSTLLVKLINERLKPRFTKLKRIAIIKKRSPLSLRKILRILRIPKSTYYYDKKATTLPNKDAFILKQIKKIKSGYCNQARNLGYRPVTAYLKQSGLNINHKRVMRIMRDNDLLSHSYNKRIRKYNSYKGNVGKIAPNRLHRNFSTEYPYRKLTTDVSEFRYGNEDIHHRVYLSPVIDLYSDEVLSFSISEHPTVKFTIDSLIAALNKRPRNLGYRTIVHSDQGYQYQNEQWRITLKQYGALQSMSRKGTCLDNAQMESFFHIMKDEMMDKHYQTEGQLVKAMKEWIYYYNHYRIKEKLGWKSPIQYQQLTA